MLCFPLGCAMCVVGRAAHVTWNPLTETSWLYLQALKMTREPEQPEIWSQ